MNADTYERPALTGVLVKLAIFTAASLVLWTVVVASLLNLDLHPSHRYHAVFTDASDLQSGDPVRIAGVAVGQVTGIHLLGTHRSEVTFKLDASQTLTRSTQADIEFENLFGERSLSLVAGPPAARLAPGGTIPVTQTTPALDLSDLFNGFEPLFQALTPSQVNQLTANVIGTFQGQSGALAGLVDQVGTLSNNLADHQQVIDSVVDNLTSLLTVIGGHNQQLAQMVDDFDHLAGALSGDRSQISSALGSADGMVSALSNETTALQGPLEGSVGSLSSVAAAMAANQRQISAAIGSLQPTFTRAAKTLQNGAFIGVYYCALSISIPKPVPLLPDPVQSAVDTLLAAAGDPPVPYAQGIDVPSGQEGNPAAHTATCEP